MPESNPFDSSNNPFSGDNPFNDSGATDDGVFAPDPVGELPPVEPEPMDEAETTRPRQIPAKRIPIQCGACKRRFVMAKISEGLRCICGADDLDLDFTANQYNTDTDTLLGNKANTYLISWELNGEQGQSVVKAERDLDAIAWFRTTMPVDRIVQIWEMPSEVMATLRQALEQDPPWGQVVEGDQPLAKLPEPELFPQFSDGPDEDLEAMAAYITRHNPEVSPKKAKWLALRAKARY